MSDNKYKELYRSKAATAISQALAVKSTIEHPSVKGGIVEGLIKDLFKPLLPPDIGIGTGHIVESFKGQCSKQQDIILYDKAILPPVLYEGEVGIYPIESVLYTIEVKTTLTAHELKKAHIAASELRTFTMRPGKRNDRGHIVNHQVKIPNSIIFAISSDLTADGKTEVERYREVYKNEFPSIRAICVVGNGYWYDEDGCWKNVPIEKPHDEVLGFVGGVMNTYKQVSDSRGHPYLGHYIIANGNNTDFIPNGSANILIMTCEKCGSKAALSQDLHIDVIDAEKIQPPCNCGGIYSAPKGRYKAKNFRFKKIEEINKEKSST